MRAHTSFHQLPEALCRPVSGLQHKYWNLIGVNIISLSSTNMLGFIPTHYYCETLSKPRVLIEYSCETGYFRTQAGPPARHTDFLSGTCRPGF